MNFRGNNKFRIISALIIAVFALQALVPQAFAQMNLNGIYSLGSVPTALPFSKPYKPLVVKAMKVYADNPLRFDFIVDKGDQAFARREFQEETERLIRYFLASLTVPEKDTWVNLNPKEQNRVIPESFGQTEMGRDLLAQDYLLKKITASLMNPEHKIGAAFWDRVYASAYEKFGTNDIDIDALSRVWIVPEKAVVYENRDKAYIVESRLKVLLEKEYLGETESRNQAGETEIIKQVILPALEKEINEGESFAQLRQIYHSLILAGWYKEKLKRSILQKLYIDRNKIKGVDLADKGQAQEIFQDYLKLFENGVGRFIREEYDPVTRRIIPRKYFTGGIQAKDFALMVKAQVVTELPADIILPDEKDLALVGVMADPVGEQITSDFALKTETPQKQEDVMRVQDYRSLIHDIQKGMNHIAAYQMIVDSYSNLEEDKAVKEFLDVINGIYTVVTDKRHQFEINMEDAVNPVLKPKGVTFSSDSAKSLELPEDVVGELNSIVQEYQSEVNKAFDAFEKFRVGHQELLRAVVEFSKEMGLELSFDGYDFIKKVINRGVSKKRQVVPVDFKEILSSVDIKMKLAGLAPDINVEQGLVFFGDEVGLYRVLANLMTNSIEAIEDKKDRNENEFVRALVQKKGNNIVITLSDSGGGMPEEVRRKILSGFGTTTKASGKGIGVYGSKLFIEEHGGTLDIDTKPGEGTTMTITLPQVTKEEQEERFRKAGILEEPVEQQENKPAEIDAAKDSDTRKDEQDKAIVAEYGGIDLTQKKFDLIKEHEASLYFDLKLQEIQQKPFDGLMPVIINVQPVSNLLVFLKEK